MSALPEGWARAKLGDLGSWRGGGTPSKAKKEFWTNGTIPWVSPKDMKKPRLSSAQDSITEAAIAGSATSKLNAGSVLLVTRSGILSHSLPAAINLVPVALNQDLKAIAPCGAVDPEFLWLTFRCFEREILNTCRKAGTTVASIEFPQLLDFTIPLPPLAEQKRIVAKIEELFSELDAGEESLRRARRQLGVYRQSLLKQAFEGKLTAPWRLSARKRAQAGAQVGDVVPEARDGQWFTYILECDADSFYVGSTRDLRERWRRHCEGTGADWTKANPPRYLVHFEAFSSEDEARKRESDLKTGFGRTWRKREIKAGRIKPLVHNANNPNTEPVRGKSAPDEGGQAGEALQTGDQLLTRIQAERRDRPDIEGLPESWLPCWLGEFVAIERGRFSVRPRNDPRYYGGDIPFVQIGDLPREGGTINSYKQTLNQAGLGVSKLFQKGTPLIAIVGATIGNTGILAFDGCCPDSLVALVTDEPISAQFVELYFRAHKDRIRNDSYASGGQPNINNAYLDRQFIGVPSLPEQQEIVRLLDEQFEVIEQNEREIDAALKRSEALRQSILRKAFTGQLVPPACRLPAGEAGQAGRTPDEFPQPRPGKWWVYVLKCSDGSFYKGFTDNLPERWKRHLAGKGAKWTKQHPPVELFYWEEHWSEASALERERLLKSGSGREWFQREVVENGIDLEPASTLLARIRAEREAAAVKRPKKTNRGKATKRATRP